MGGRLNRFQPHHSSKLLPFLFFVWPLNKGLRSHIVDLLEKVKCSREKSLSDFKHIITNSHCWHVQQFAELQQARVTIHSGAIEKSLALPYSKSFFRSCSLFNRKASFTATDRFIMSTESRNWPIRVRLYNVHIKCLCTRSITLAQ